MMPSHYPNINEKIEYTINYSSSFQTGSSTLIKLPNGGLQEILHGNASAFTIFHDEFYSFIQKRIRYVRSLKDLGDNWSNGNSKAPSIGVLKLAEAFLSQFRESLSFDKQKPEIIMGPIEVGGFSIQIFNTWEDSILLSLYNDNTVSIEYKNESGFGEESEINSSNFIPKSIERYVRLHQE